MQREWDEEVIEEQSRRAVVVGTVRGSKEGIYGSRAMHSKV